MSRGTDRLQRRTGLRSDRRRPHVSRQMQRSASLSTGNVPVAGEPSVWILSTRPRGGPIHREFDGPSRLRPPLMSHDGSPLTNMRDDSLASARTSRSSRRVGLDLERTGTRSLGRGLALRHESLQTEPRRGRRALASRCFGGHVPKDRVSPSSVSSGHRGMTTVRIADILAGPVPGTRRWETGSRMDKRYGRDGTRRSILDTKPVDCSPSCQMRPVISSTIGLAAEETNLTRRNSAC